MKFYELNSEGRVTYVIDAEFTTKMESIKTGETDAKFYELKDKHVLPFIKSNNSGNAIARLTY